MKMRKNLSNQKGQTLIFVVLVMAIALAVGVSISTRTLSSVRRITNVDTSSRALAFAESGAEYVLGLSVNCINDILDNNRSDPATCVQTSSSGLSYDCDDTQAFSYQPNISQTQLNSSAEGDQTPFRADIEVKRYGCMGNNDESVYQIDKDEVLELKFDGNQSANLRIRWTYPSGGNPSSLYLMEIYEPSAGNYQVRKKGYNLPGSTYSNNFEVIVPPGFVNYSTQSTARILRFLSLYNSSTLTLEKLGGANVAYQGFEITSTGVIGTGTNEVRRKVIVTRSLPYLPAIFNFGLYSGSTTSGITK